MFRMRLIKASEVAAKLGVPRRTMSQWCKDGVVHCTKVGHDYYVSDRRALKRYDSITPPPDVESVAALAEELGVSRRTASRWSMKGTIPSFRVGRVYRISRREFEVKVLEHFGLDEASGG